MPNIHEGDLQRYVEAFHETYRGTAATLIPPDVRDDLVRLPLIEKGVRGVISTKSGAGYEYIPDEVGFALERGSASIEDVFLGTPPAVRKLSVTGVGLENTSMTIERVSFLNGYPFRLFGEAFVRLIDVHCEVSGWIRDVVFAELSTNRSTDYWSPEAAVRRAKDELLIAVVDLREVERKRGTTLPTLGTYLTQFREKHVLLCGDFTSGRERLIMLRELLENEGYVVTLLDDVPDEPHHDLRFKFRAIAPVVRFVVIDNSSRSGQMVELELASQLQAVTVVLNERGSDTSFMTAAPGATSSVINEAEYDARDAADVVRTQAEWAEATLARLARSYESVFPWRRPSESAKADT
jgi:hypothetical protein